MMKAVALKCSSCGAGLNVPPDVDQFACGFCGSTQMVERGGGIIALEPVIDAIKQVQNKADKAAAELALRRLNEEWKAATERRENLIRHWQQHYDDAGGSSLNTALILAPLVGIVILVICKLITPQVLEGLGIRLDSSMVGNVVGVILGAPPAIYILVNSHNQARKEEAKVAAQRDKEIQQADAHLQSLSEQIEKYKGIVNS
jgi:ribosomal protein S27AE